MKTEPNPNQTRKKTWKKHEKKKRKKNRRPPPKTFLVFRFFRSSANGRRFWRTISSSRRMALAPGRIFRGLFWGGEPGSFFFCSFGVFCVFEIVFVCLLMFFWVVYEILFFSFWFEFVFPLSSLFLSLWTVSKPLHAVHEGLKEVWKESGG